MKNFSQDHSEPGSSQNSSNERNEAHIDNTNINDDNDVLMTGTDEDSKSSKSSNANTNDPSNSKTYSKYNLLSILNEPSPSSPSYSSYNSLREQCDSQTHMGSGSSSSNQANEDNDDDLYATPSSSSRRSENANYADVGSSSRNRNVEPSDEEMFDTIDNPHEMSDTEYYPSNSRSYDDDDGDDDDDDDDDEDDNDDDDDEEEDDDEDEDDDDNDEENVVENMDEEDDETQDFRSDRDLLFRTLRGAFGFPESALSSFGMSDQLSSSIEAITQQDDPSTVLTGLQTLAEVLLMSNEDFLNQQLQVQKVLDALVSIMSNPLYEDNIQMIIMACRCLSNLLDANPSSLDRLSYSKVVKALCEKLFEIQYIDVAELALTALRKISRCQTNAILENGGLTACLSYLDFFSLSTQRIATEIVANTLRSIPTKYFDSVKDAIPLIENLLGNTDKEIMKNISTAICGIVENFKFSAEKIEALITPTVSKKLFSYLDPNIATEAMITPTVIKAVGVIVKVSSKLTKTAIESHLISNLYQILTKHAPTFDENDNEVFLPEKNNSTIIQSLIYTPKDILLNSLTVILNIFPSVGADSEEQKANPYRVNYSSESEETNAKERGEYLLKLSSISTISAISMSLLIDVFSSTVDIDIRRMVLQSLIKITHFLPPDVLYKSVQNVELSSLLSSIISQEDHPTLVLGSLDIACNLISKLPSFYAVSFFRGGIISEIETLLEKEKEKERKKEEEEKAKKALEEDKSQQIAEESEEAEKTTTESGIETPTLLTRVNSSSTSASSNRNLERSNTDDDEDEELDDDDDEDDEEEEEEEDDDDDDYDENEEMERRNISISSQFQTPSFYTDLSPLIVQEATCILSIYESQLETENFSSEIKEKFNQLIALEEKIRNRDNLAIQFNQLFELIPGVSQFELLRSHILRSLLTVLTTGTESDILNAQKTFMQCAIKDNFQSFETLINHLNDSLSRFERFEVLSSETSVVNSTPESIRRQFARQVKINLVPLTPKPPKKQKSIVISTQAIASLKAIDDFYKQKVQTESDHFSASTGTFTQILDSTVPENTTATSSSSNLPTSGNSSTTSVNSTSNENTNNAGPSNSGSSHASDTESIEQSRKNVKIEDISVRNSHSNDFNWHLDFYLDGKPIPTETTIYGAIYKSLAAKEEEKKLKGEHYRTDITQLVWSRAHVINFKKKPGSWVPFKDNSLEAESIDPSVEVPKSFGSNASLSIVVRLLNTLFRMNSNLTDFFDPNTIKTVNPVALTSFSSSKLTAKLNRQLEEPLIVVSGIVPQWTVDACRLYPFLFPFETRHLFLQSTSFGHSRLMNKWQNEINERNRRSMDRIPRQKVRISRDHMFYNGIKLMELYGSSPYALEVEFFDDVGTGLGPTLEFYTTFSKDFTQKSLNMWRNDDGDSESKYVFSKNGLFPKPHDEKYFSTKQGKHLLSLFRSLGIFVARSLIDSRIIDLNFNPLFFRISQFGASHQNIGMLSLVDKQLENSMKFLERFVEARDSQGSSGEVKVDNSSIDDLSLDFTLPGQSDIELVPGGSNINVNIDNVDEYIKLVLDMTLGAGIAKQIASFKEGISTIMPYSALHSFTPEELVVLCGQEEADWTYETLCTSIKADHGYTLDSPVVQYLLEVMAEFTKEERKAFLQFSTGSRNLPIGGFPSLRPPFTVVCRDSDPPYTPNDYLPTVMTCVNYFKLPNYSSKEILRERLLTAMNEGSGCFLLS